ncbi:MAG: 16S rRNA processing protein RimM [Deltaproteobacteria bacterium]|nr:16S rRNA processing protein RimM [Deltaproteobacteria bacterium]
MGGLSGNLLWAGTIIGPHGLRGGMKVRSSPDRRLLLENRRRVVLRHPDGTLDPRQVMTVATGKGVFLRLKEVEEVGEAEQLRGCDILVEAEELPDDPGSDSYPFTLIGLSVIDQRLGELGAVEDFFATAAHGILVVEGPRGEVLIPALPQFLIRVDRERKELLVALPDGLVAEN